MNKNEKEAHLTFIKAHGKFRPGCSYAIFDTTEIAILETHGHWLEALANGTLKPLDVAQEHFVEVAHKRQTAETQYEKVWVKYLKRKEIEAKNPSLNIAPKPNDDPFYTRDQAKDLKQNLFKWINTGGKRHSSGGRF